MRKPSYRLKLSRDELETTGRCSQTWPTGQTAVSDYHLGPLEQGSIDAGGGPAKTEFYASPALIRGEGLAGADMWTVQVTLRPSPHEVKNKAFFGGPILDSISNIAGIIRNDANDARHAGDVKRRV